VRFIEPMLLLPAQTLPEGPEWTYELKLDGYRAPAIKTGGTVRLRSWNDEDLKRKYPENANALAALPDETAVDGEVVALEEAERPWFNALQIGTAGAAIFCGATTVLRYDCAEMLMETQPATRTICRDRCPLGRSVKWNRALSGHTIHGVDSENSGQDSHAENLLSWTMHSRPGGSGMAEGKDVHCSQSPEWQGAQCKIGSRTAW
jgi:hypothetical protein